MENKELIWIDDRIDDMKQVVRGTFPLLWKKGIFSKTIFFGDAIKEVDEQLVRGYQYTVSSEFFELRKKFSDLTAPEAAGVRKIEAYLTGDRDAVLSTLAARISLTESSIHDVVTAWKQGVDLNIWKADQKLPTQFDVTPIFDDMNANSDKAFALDIVLLDGDEEKLNCEEKYATPIISMELYHYITEQLNAKCTLYTRYTYLNRLQNNWIRLYTARYGDNNKQIVIHSRQGLYEGQLSPSVQAELTGHFETKGGSGAHVIAADKGSE